MTLLLGSMLTFGFMFFGANVLQQAADVGAQEFARLPLPPLAEFPELGTTGRSSTDPTATISSGAANVFADPDFRAEIFDEQYLVVDLDSDLGMGETIDEYFADKPLINRLLRPLMVYDERTVSGMDRRLVRYPGALVENQNNNDELTVLVPRITSRDQTVPDEDTPISETEIGRETGIAWHAVLEEIRDNSGEGSLSVVSSDATPNPDIVRGMVGLRINYPYQAGAMIAYQYELENGTVSGDTRDALANENILNHAVTAIDPEGTGFDPPTPYSLVVAAFDPDTDSDASRTNSGRFGLGFHHAFTKTVRPYRKILTAQGIYRREVFE